MQAASSESLQTKAGAETDDKKEQGGDGRDRRVPDRICMESDSDSIFLLYFKSNTNTNSTIVGYKYKMNVSDIDLIYELTFYYFLY